MMINNETILKCVGCGRDSILSDRSPVPVCEECLKHVEDPSPGTRPLMRSSSRPVFGYIYLIKTETGLYKIGKAKDLGKRLKPFSVNFPMRWELIHSFRSGDYSKAEEDLHNKFNDKRDVGEWFRLSPSDVIFITSLQDGSL